MTRYERYWTRGNQPFHCAICGGAVIYDSIKKETTCGCKVKVKCEITKAEMRRHTLQGIEWREVF